MRFGTCMLMAFAFFAILGGSALSAESLRLINVRVSSQNCTGGPIIVVARDDALGDALRAEVRVQWSEPGYAVRNGVYLNWTNSSTGIASYTPSVKGTYYIQVSRPGYLTFTTSLSVRDCPQCLRDADCEDWQVCSEEKCANVTGECGYAAGHGWNPYECCSDSGCAEDEYCLENRCEKITGECGYAADHGWRAYTCCADEDCGQGEICVGHACVRKTGCAEDAECLDSQRCADGTCVNIVGECGYAAGHGWNPYECCSDSGCESGWCLPGNVCSAVSKPEEKAEQEATGALVPFGIAVVGAVLMLAMVVAGALFLLPALGRKPETPEGAKPAKNSKKEKNGG